MQLRLKTLRSFIEANLSILILSAYNGPEADLALIQGHDDVSGPRRYIPLGVNPAHGSPCDS